MCKKRKASMKPQRAPRLPEATRNSTRTGLHRMLVMPLYTMYTVHYSKQKTKNSSRTGLERMLRMPLNTMYNTM